VRAQQEFKKGALKKPAFCIRTHTRERTYRVVASRKRAFRENLFKKKRENIILVYLCASERGEDTLLEEDDKNGLGRVDGDD